MVADLFCTSGRIATSVLLLVATQFAISKGETTPGITQQCSASSWSSAGSDVALRLQWTFAKCVLDFDSGASVLQREPLSWLPLELRPSASAGDSVLITDVELRLPSCAPLWDLAERECTLRVSAYWPSPGLQAGPGYLHYARLEGPGSTAQAVKLTCPPSDWAALLSAAGGLAPCGTALVSSAEELSTALQALQPVSTRLLLTLTANISLPAAPDESLAAAASGSLDDTPAPPLHYLYRNTTIAASTVRGRTAVELDLGRQAGAFDLLTARQRGTGRPVLVMADVSLVNLPQGPLSTWPVGLLTNWHHYALMDRSGSGGLQVVQLRSKAVTPDTISYVAVWASRMRSPDPAVAASADWLFQLTHELGTTIIDDDGTVTRNSPLSDFVVGFNTSGGAPLLTSPWPLRFSLSKLQDLEAAPLPPASVALAANASALRSLLQDEAWTGGTRVILLLRNVTLTPDNWPADGLPVSYRSMLVGPAVGPPVALRMDGALKRLFRGGGAAAPSVGGPSGAPAGPAAAAVRLVALQLEGVLAAALAAPPGGSLGPAAAAALAATSSLKDWRDRCMSRVDAAGAAANGTEVALEVSNSTLTATPRLLRLMAILADPASRPAVGSPLGDLLRRWVGASGQIMFSTAPSAVFTNASLGDGLLSLLDSTAASGAATIAVADAFGDCGAVSLAIAAGAVPATDPTDSGPTSPIPSPSAGPSASPSPGPAADGGGDGGGGANTAAIVGGAVGGAVGLALLAGVVAAVARRRRQRDQGPGSEGMLGKDAASHKQPLECSAHNPKGDAAAAGTGPGKPSALVAGLSPGDDAAGLIVSEGGGGFSAGSAVVVAVAAEEGGAVEAREEPGATPGAAAGDTSLFSYASGCAMAANMFRLGAHMGPLAGPKPDSGPGPGPASPYSPAARVAALRANGSASLPSGETRSRDPLHDTIEHEIGHMLASVKSAAASRSLLAAAGGPGPAAITSAGAAEGEQQLPVLGWGGYGIVYLGQWRGLPAAFKIIMLQSGDSETRWKRLAREVALTMALSHPNVVPTYDYDLESIGVHTPLSPQPAGVRLRVVMQYCEGGSLRQALGARRLMPPPPDWPPEERIASSSGPSEAGFKDEASAADEIAFGAAGRVAAADEGGGTPGLPRSFSSRSGGSEAHASSVAGEHLRGAPVAVPPATAPAALAVAEAEGDEREPAAAGAADDEGAAEGGLRPLPAAESGKALASGDAVGKAAGQGGAATLGAASSATASNASSASRGSEVGAAGGRPALGPAAAVSSGVPVPSALLLPLVAARDILRGLSFLHSQGVIHGDLTDANVLLKAVEPQLRSAAATATGAGSTSAADGGTSSSGGGAMASGFRRLASLRTHHTNASTAAAPASGPDPRVWAAAGAGASAAARLSPVKAEASGEATRGEAGGEAAAGGAAASAGRAEGHSGGGGSGAVETGVAANGAAAVCGLATSSSSGGDAAGHRSGGEGAGAAGTPRFRRQESSATTLLVSTSGSSTTTPSDPQAPFSNCTAQGGPNLHSNQHLCWTATLADQDLEATAKRLLSFSFKLADFGLSVQLQGHSQTHVSHDGCMLGTPFFAAPELLNSPRLTTACDMYSFGVVLWLLLHGSPLGSVRHLLPHAPYMPAAPSLLRHTSPSLPPGAAALLRRCLDLAPRKRPSAQEALQTVEELLRAEAGPPLAQLLSDAEVREVVLASTATPGHPRPPAADQASSSCLPLMTRRAAIGC